MGLFGNKDSKKNIPQQTTFDVKAGVILKGPTTKEWKLTEEGIEVGNNKWTFTDISKIEYSIPSNKFQQGVVTLYMRNGKTHLLGYAFLQKDIAVQAVEYIKERMINSISPEQRAAREEMEAFMAGKERRIRCNVCGQLFCYSYQDLLNNQKLAKQARNASVLGALNTIATSQVLGSQQQAEADRKLAQIRDYSHCPNCNSTDLKQLTDEEYKEALEAKNAPAAPAALSAADELKKFKELLDMGIITQEEFDAKKKQLLGL